MLTCATLFSGCGGADAGLRAAGFTPVWAIERDPDIAAIYERNFGHSPIVNSIENVNPNKLPEVDLLHMSPPCQEHSILKRGRKKKTTAAEEGRANVGYATIPFIQTLQPRFVTLENVEGYKRAPSFRAIVRCLEFLDYFVDWQVLNAADFGVPQSRRRLILRAVRGDRVPSLPFPTRRMGWYEAIEDLIPSLPDCELANWQKKALPPRIINSLLMSPGNSKAEGKRWKLPIEPAWSVCTMGYPRAILFPRVGARDYKRKGLKVFPEKRPAPTVKALGHDGHWQQLDAIVFYRNGASLTNGRLAVTSGIDPAPTVKAANSSKNVHQMDAIASGRTVKITPQALARFQNFPDDFWFPESPVLATRAIGNAVPPRMMEAIARSLLSVNLDRNKLPPKQLQLF